MVIEWPSRLNLELPKAWHIKLEYFSNGGRLLQVRPPEKEDKNSSTSK